MNDELYADRVGEISITGAIVRIDLVSLSASQKDAAGQAVPVLRQRVIMSVEGFANSFDVLQKAMQGLIDAGAVRRTEPASNVADITSRSGETKQAEGGSHKTNSSPNFN